MTSIRKVALACMTAAMVTMTVDAGAQGPRNQDTFFTFSLAVELPKTTLPAGTYFFQLMDSDSNRHIVKVMSQDRKQLHATLMAIPYYSNDRPSDEPQVRFLETPAANGVAATNAIKIWFYPGNSVGHEFIWPRDKATQLAKATGQSVLTTKTDEESSDLMRVDSAGAEAAVNATEASAGAAQASAQSSTATQTQTAQTMQTQTAQTQSEQTAQTQQREQVGALGTPARTESATMTDRTADQTARDTTADRAPRTDLPNTAGMLPLLALIGIGSLVGSRMLRRSRGNAK
jgi:hypothetical protein